MGFFDVFGGIEAWIPLSPNPRPAAPKPETRNPNQIRNPNTRKRRSGRPGRPELAAGGCGDSAPGAFAPRGGGRPGVAPIAGEARGRRWGFGDSDFGLASDFEPRISDLQVPITNWRGEVTRVPIVEVTARLATGAGLLLSSGGASGSPQSAARHASRPPSGDCTSRVGPVGCPFSARSVEPPESQ